MMGAQTGSNTFDAVKEWHDLTKVEPRRRGPAINQAKQKETAYKLRWDRHGQAHRLDCRQLLRPFQNQMQPRSGQRDYLEGIAAIEGSIPNLWQSCSFHGASHGRLERVTQRDSHEPHLTETYRPNSTESRATNSLMSMKVIGYLMRRQEIKVASIFARTYSGTMTRSSAIGKDFPSTEEPFAKVKAWAQPRRVRAKAKDIKPNASFLTWKALAREEVTEGRILI